MSDPAAVELFPQQQRLERAINLARFVGAVLAPTLAPLLPNLGPGYVLAFSAALLAFAFLAWRVRQGTMLQEQPRFALLFLVIDALISTLALFVYSPDPRWSVLIIGPLFISTGAFRFGAPGGVAALLTLIGAVLAIAFFREAALGIPFDPEQITFVLSIYGLSAVFMIAALRELGAVRGLQTHLYAPLIQAQSDLGEAVVIREGERVVYLNDAMTTLTGYTMEDLRRMDPVFDLVVPEDREDVRHRGLGLREGTDRMEISLQRKDGGRVEVEIVTKAFRIAERAGSVAIVRDITERKRALRAFEYQALHDPLTELPNRALLIDRLHQAILNAKRQRTSVSLILMDLDHFKEINDTLGHHVGDALLRQVGPRLAGQLRERDTVARLGGDEFAMIVPAADAIGAGAAALNLMRAVERPFEIESQPLRVSCSIGIAVFPTHGPDADALLQRADIAMYVAKRSGGSGYAFYDPEHDRYDPARLALLGDLRDAISRRQLVLHYQPLVRVANGDLVSVEALVRWQHPTRGLIPPGEFIPFAERTGLIRVLTERVLEMALRQVRAWRDKGLAVSVSVNLSMRSVLDADLPELIAGLLRANDVDPSWLGLEITESTMMVEPDRALQTLAALRDMGVGVSVDDFGTGYSSLAYLNRLPVAAIKIDQAFVTRMASDPGSAAIVRATIGLGHALGFEVVAEGVEDGPVLSALAEDRCDLAQGYHIARPMTAEALESWLRAREAVPVRA